MTDTARTAHGWGLATVHESGQVLDSWFPAPALGEPDDSPAPQAVSAAVTDDAARRVRTEAVHVVIDLDAAPQDTPDAYLRLHLLSHCLVAPNTINLDGIFGVLPNVAWTSAGPCALEDFEKTRAEIGRASCRERV